VIPLRKAEPVRCDSARPGYTRSAERQQATGKDQHHDRPIQETTMSASTRGNTDITALARRRSRGEETKPSFKTSELVVYVLAVVGVLIASNVVGDGANNDGRDYFAADKAWWYITLLTIGYLISRGLAKAGSRSSDTDPRTETHSH
jgi:hypothetical protein